MDNEDNFPKNQENSLEKIARTEKQTKNKQTKYYNQRMLHDYWTEYPILRLIPTTIIYIGGKLIRKI